MSEPRRYDLGYGSETVETTDGDWVRYDDYARLRNPNAVNCDGLHADGSAPNTPHRPIGIIRDHPCPACEALLDLARLRAAIVEYVTAEADYDRANHATCDDSDVCGRCRDLGIAYNRRATAHAALLRIAGEPRP